MDFCNSHNQNKKYTQFLCKNNYVPQMDTNFLYRYPYKLAIILQ